MNQSKGLLILGLISATGLVPAVGELTVEGHSSMTNQATVPSGPDEKFFLRTGYLCVTEGYDCLKSPLTGGDSIATGGDVL